MDSNGEVEGSDDGDGKGDGSLYDNNGDSGGGGGDDTTMTQLRRQWTGNGNAMVTEMATATTATAIGRQDGGNSNANRRHGSDSNGVMAT